VKQLVNMNEELLKILETLKEDFEMLQDGSWDLNYSDGSVKNIPYQKKIKQKKEEYYQKHN